MFKVTTLNPLSSWRCACGDRPCKCQTDANKENYVVPILLLCSVFCLRLNRCDPHRFRDSDTAIATPHCLKDNNYRQWQRPPPPGAFPLSAIVSRPCPHHVVTMIGLPRTKEKITRHIGRRSSRDNVCRPGLPCHAYARLSRIFRCSSFSPSKMHFSLSLS